MKKREDSNAWKVSGLRQKRYRCTFVKNPVPELILVYYTSTTAVDLKSPVVAGSTQ